MSYLRQRLIVQAPRAAIADDTTFEDIPVARESPDLDPRMAATVPVGLGAIHRVNDVWDTSTQYEEGGDYYYFDTFAGDVHVGFWVPAPLPVVIEPSITGAIVLRSAAHTFTAPAFSSSSSGQGGATEMEFLG